MGVTKKKSQQTDSSENFNNDELEDAKHLDKNESKDDGEDDDLPELSDDSKEKYNQLGKEESVKEVRTETKNNVVDFDKDESMTVKLASEDIITVDDTVDLDIRTKTISDEEFFAAVSEEEKQYFADNGVVPEQIEDMNIQCTACWKQVNHHVRNNIMRHPQLGVPICRSCKYFYEDDGEWVKDSEGSDCYCRWCANGGEMVCCDKCSNAYCKRCIQRNLSRKHFTEINECEHWNCFQCDPKPIYPQRALMCSIIQWNVFRRDKKKKLEKEAKHKNTKKVTELKQKQTAEELKKVENFIDENMQEAFNTLQIYQKCLEDERHRWLRNKKTWTPENVGPLVAKLRKIYGIVKQNMELLDSTLLQRFLEQFPEESVDKFMPGKIVPGAGVSQKLKCIAKTTSPAVKSKSAKPMPTQKKIVSSPSYSVSSPEKLVFSSVGLNVSNQNKRKMKDTSNKIPKKSKSVNNQQSDEDIAVEEIVMNGEPILSSKEYFDPSQLCSIQITDETVPPAPPKIPPVTRPSGQLRISSKMFKKKSPSKRPATPDSDIEEILIDDDKAEADADSDVSLDF